MESLQSVLSTADVFVCVNVNVNTCVYVSVIHQVPLT